jgi:hypothetical protein
MCIAVRDRIELSKGDLKNNNIAGFVVNPYYFSISLSLPTRRVGVFAIGSYPISPPYNLRKLRDSNPRYNFSYDGFQDRSIQPLWQAS